jgi:hypothetical protein
VAELATYKDAPKKDGFVLVILKEYADKTAACRRNLPTLALDGTKLRDHLNKPMLWSADRLQLHHDEDHT